jgi:hypothetical protein
MLSFELKDSPFRKRMKEIFTEVRETHPQNTGKAGVHKARIALFLRLIGCPKTGPYAMLRTHLEKGVPPLLLTVSTRLTQGCDKAFEGLFRNFDHICPVQEERLGGFRAWQGAQYTCRRCKEEDGGSKGGNEERWNEHRMSVRELEDDLRLARQSQSLDARATDRPQDEEDTLAEGTTCRSNI